MKTHLFPFISVALVFAVSSCKKSEPQTLDLSAHYSDKFDEKSSGDGVTGKKVYDGLPFVVNGRVTLYGKQTAEGAGKRLDEKAVRGGA